MILQIIYTIILITALSTIIFLVEYLHTHFLIDHEYTRKIAHVLATLSSLIFLIENISTLSVFFIAIFFSILLAIGKIKGYFTAIDYIGSKTIGSIVLPLSVFFIYYLSHYFHKPVLFILPLLILAISDPLAWFTGTYFKNRVKRILLFHHLTQKTFMGSAAFFISSFVITLITLLAFNYQFSIVILTALLISGVGTIVEFISPNGTDNLLVPLVTAVMLIYL